jgi:ribosomal-protein-alanine N-acetyltransferase
MELPVLIRRACENDLAQILDIEMQCHTVNWSPASFKTEINKKDNINLVAENSEKKICGYLFSFIAADIIEINSIAVNPNYQRKGIAQKLIKEIEKIGINNNVSEIRLEVREKNLPAISLYKKCGFKICWIRKNYYSNSDENALIMTKKI